MPYSTYKHSFTRERKNAFLKRSLMSEGSSKKMSVSVRVYRKLGKPFFKYGAEACTLSRANMLKPGRKVMTNSRRSREVCGDGTGDSPTKAVAVSLRELSRKIMKANR